jgi:hypothetical protein
MDPKAQEEAERERKREAIRQRIAAAKAASAGAAAGGAGEDSAAKDKTATSPNDDRKEPETTAIVEQTSLSVPGSTQINFPPDCYDVDASSFLTLPLPTKEAGDAFPAACLYLARICIQKSKILIMLGEQGRS